MNIQLSDHFTYGKLLRFTFPSIVMMIFTSIYGVVDGLFVSNFAGSTSFAAINLIMPFLMVFSTIGFMVGAGGSALVAKTFGEGKNDEAKEIFSMLVYLMLGAGLVVTIVGEIVLKPVAIALGANKSMLPICIRYGRIILLGMIPLILQTSFQTFMVTAERPNLGLAVTVGAGVTNMLLDFLLVGVLKLEVVGAAWATFFSMAVGGIWPLLFFILPNRSLLRLRRPSIGRKAINYLWKTFTNGLSEFLSNLSLSLVNMVYNARLMGLIGEDGVTAYGIIMYVNFIFLAMFFGYTMGTAPIISFHFGAGNKDELKSIFKKSIIILAASSVIMTVLAEALSKPLARIFVGYSDSLLALSTRALMMYSLSFLLAGFNIFGSGFFTALNNGLVSGVISFGRVLVFQLASVLVLPEVFGSADGVWLAMVSAEILAAIVTFIFFKTHNKKYGYM